ncbi:hypothetical protein PM082_012069 [Marasmius tenuissimus]|nr:hypothetical protein PM082_012069 [Marasmius tenuissimus]
MTIPQQGYHSELIYSAPPNRNLLQSLAISPISALAILSLLEVPLSICSVSLPRTIGRFKLDVALAWEYR